MIWMIQELCKNATREPGTGTGSATSTTSSKYTTTVPGPGLALPLPCPAPGTCLVQLPGTGMIVRVVWGLFLL